MGELLTGGQWCCEAVLWTPWIHVGTMSADVDCELMHLSSAALRDVTKTFLMDGRFARRYASVFCRILNSDDTRVSDVMRSLGEHESIRRALDPNTAAKCDAESESGSELGASASD